MNRHITPLVLVYEERPEQKNSLYSKLENQQLDVMPCVNRLVLESAGFISPPDVVVMDISVNQRDKAEACKLILESKSYHNTKLLLVKEPNTNPLPFVPANRLVGYVNKPLFDGDLLGKLHASIYDKYANIAN